MHWFGWLSSLSVENRIALGGVASGLLVGIVSLIFTALARRDARRSSASAHETERLARQQAEDAAAAARRTARAMERLVDVTVAQRTGAPISEPHKPVSWHASEWTDSQLTLFQSGEELASGINVSYMYTPDKLAYLSMAHLESEVLDPRTRSIKVPDQITHMVNDINAVRVEWERPHPGGVEVLHRDVVTDVERLTHEEQAHHEPSDDGR